MRLGGAVDVAQRRSRRDACAPAFDIDLDALETGHVERDATIGQRQARDVVPGALDGELHPVVAGEVHGPDHVVGAGGAHHDGRPLRDHPVPERDRLGIAGVVRPQDGSGKVVGELAERADRDAARLAVDAVEAQCFHVISWGGVGAGRLPAVHARLGR